MAKWLIKKDIEEKFPTVVLNDKNEERAGGLVLGYENVRCRQKGKLPFSFEEKRVYVDGSDSHTLIIGSTGSKKSRLLVMPTVISLLKAGENVIVSDPKKEIYNMTYDLAEKEGYKIITLDFREPKRSSRWNPFEVLGEAIKSQDRDRILKEVHNLAENFIVIPEGRDPFWMKASVEFLENILLINVIKGEADLKSFMENVKSVEKFFSDYELRKIYNLTEGIYNLVGYGVRPGRVKFLNNKFYFDRFDEFIRKWAMYPTNTRGSVFATMSSNLQIFKTNDTLIENSAIPDFSYRDILGEEQKTIVYLIIPEENTAYEMMIKMFVEQSYSYLITQIQEKFGARAPRRINYVLDEFANIPKINGFEKNISISRSRNIRFFLVVQDISQIAQRYGENNAYTIVGNCNNLAYLYCNDIKTNEFIHGKVRDKISYTSLTTLNSENGEVMFLMGRRGEYIGFLEDISCVMEMVNNSSCYM